MAMVASDGPHYGENLKLDGYGKYRVEYRISPPSMNDNVAFGRHIDKETGVAPWFEPFDVSGTSSMPAPAAKAVTEFII